MKIIALYVGVPLVLLTLAIFTGSVPLSSAARRRLAQDASVPENPRNRTGKPPGHGAFDPGQAERPRHLQDHRAARSTPHLESGPGARPPHFRQATKAKEPLLGTQVEPFGRGVG